MNRCCVVLDGTDKEICINPHEYPDFAYGYAATIHKTQGITVGHAFVYAGGAGWNRHLMYVALSIVIPVIFTLVKKPTKANNYCNEI